MTRLALCLLLPLCLVNFGDLTYSAELPPSEISTLKVIAKKLKIGPALWNFSLEPCFGWEKSDPEAFTSSELRCDCDNTTNVCHVDRIILRSMNLTGEFPEEFSNLTKLISIDLERNYINGSIPPSLAKLRLVYLSLLGNRISGEIPKEIGNISTLWAINLQSNQLTGRIPDSLSNLSALRGIGFSGNDLVGELPPSLGKLSLTDFWIDGTGLSGKLPSFIGNWAFLNRLLMRGTSLEGPFPSTFSKLTKMEMLLVTDFKGDGGFPPIENMNSSLKYLFLRNCSISGPIPEYLGNFFRLEELDLSFNKFTGRIPPSLEALSGTIRVMFLTNNRLNGKIPDWIFGRSNIDLSYNYFTGPDKGSCQLSGVNLVSSFQSSQSNKITPFLRKNLPCSTNAKNYELFINCGGDGDITVDEKKYEKDNIQSGISYFSHTRDGVWAYSSNGYFIRDVKTPFRRTNSSALKTRNPLYLSARTSASSLKYYGLCLQTGIYKVELHFAEIVFTDDQTYTSVGRRIFDVLIQDVIVLEDFNIAKEANGTGRGIVKSFNASVSNGTLEIGFRWSGKGTNTVPKRGDYGPLISAISVTPNFIPKNFSGSKDDGISSGSKDDGLSSVKSAGIIIASLVAIFLIILIPYILLRKKEQKNEELKQLKLQGTYFSLKQIKAATKNFDPKNKIGEGGFGPVYKGALKGGFKVAVKQLSSKSKQGNREFVNEIGMIFALQHPNLVKLFGCCIEGRQLLLVYEYLENNSLARALFGPENSRLKLDWRRRCKMALDTARGLAYLHEESTLKIVHRDIKAANILLDKHLDAKISDFGLAKLDDEEDTHINTRIAGTFGYMAPEYAMSGHLTEKADVYSYGVVLLEIISGRSTKNYGPMEDFVHFVDWANSLKDEGKLLELVDPSMGSNFSETEAERMLNLALLCANPSPTLRPSMTSVVNMIEKGTQVVVSSTTII